LSGSLKEEGLFLTSDTFYQEKNILFSRSKKISAVNPYKKTVYSKDKGTIEYDLLVVASGRRIAAPDISGIKKPGVVTLQYLDDFKLLTGRLIMDTVCLVGDGTIALKCAEAIAAKYNVEVKLISNKLSDTINHARIEIINDRIAEIIGEGGVQAVKLQEGKVIAASLVLLMQEGRDNIDFLKGTSLESRDGFILVDQSGRTNLEGIFACGSVCVLRDHPVQAKGWDEVIGESSVLAETLAKTVKELRCQIL